jgi:hypothetical protein
MKINLYKNLEKVGRQTVTWTLDVCLNQANKFDEDPFHLWAIYEEKGMD